MVFSHETGLVCLQATAIFHSYKLGLYSIVAMRALASALRPRVSLLRSQPQSSWLFTPAKKLGRALGEGRVYPFTLSGQREFIATRLSAGETDFSGEHSITKPPCRGPWGLWKRGCCFRQTLTRGEKSFNFLSIVLIRKQLPCPCQCLILSDRHLGSLTAALTYHSPRLSRVSCC